MIPLQPPRSQMYRVARPIRIMKEIQMCFLQMVRWEVQLDEDNALN